MYSYGSKNKSIWTKKKSNFRLSFQCSNANKEIYRIRKKSGLKRSRTVTDHETSTLRESIGKRTYFKKEMREEKKNTLCLYMSAN